MLETLKKYRKLIIAGFFVAALIAFNLFGGPRYGDPSQPSVPDETNIANVSEKNTETILFGVWSPDQNRAILAQVESDNEIAVSSELNGTLSSVNVNIGDTVREGQILARFKLSNDPTQINYLNAVSNLTATQATSDSNVQSSEIALRNAEAELSQTISQQGQTSDQSLSSLKTQAKAAETTINNTLTFLDRQLGATNAYTKETVFGRNTIGAKNTILTSKTKSNLRILIPELRQLQRQVVGQTSFEIKQYTQARIDFAERVKTELNNYNTLISYTLISANFSTADQSTIQSQTDALKPGLDNLITNLTSLIQGTKGTTEGNKTAILSAQNRVKSAREQLEIAKSQAAAQVIGARAQVNSASAATTDLIVRAPIGGKIVEKKVNRGEQVSVGSPLFTIVNEQASKKVVAFLSNDEWNKVQVSQALNIEIDDQIISTEQSFLSARVDPSSQKIRAEFLLPQETDVLVGSFVKVLIPLQSESGNILPISAIAFEPDGAEVLIVGDNRLAARQKVLIGNIVADSVQVLNGLDTETEVVQFRNRAFAGEKIIKSNP